MWKSIVNILNKNKDFGNKFISHFPANAIRNYVCHFFGYRSENDKEDNMTILQNKITEIISYKDEKKEENELNREIFSYNVEIYKELINFLRTLDLKQRLDLLLASTLLISFFLAKSEYKTIIYYFKKEWIYDFKNIKEKSLDVKDFNYAYKLTKLDKEKIIKFFIITDCIIKQQLLTITNFEYAYDDYFLINFIIKKIRDSDEIEKVEKKKLSLSKILSIKDLFLLFKFLFDWKSIEVEWVINNKSFVENSSGERIDKKSLNKNIIYFAKISNNNLSLIFNSKFDIVKFKELEKLILDNKEKINPSLEETKLNNAYLSYFIFTFSKENFISFIINILKNEFNDKNIYDLLVRGSNKIRNNTIEMFKQLGKRKFLPINLADINVLIDTEKYPISINVSSNKNIVTKKEIYDELFPQIIKSFNINNKIKKVDIRDFSLKFFLDNNNSIGEEINDNNLILDEKKDIYIMIKASDKSEKISGEKTIRLKIQKKVKKEKVLKLAFIRQVFTMTIRYFTKNYQSCLNSIYKEYDKNKLVKISNENYKNLYNDYFFEMYKFFSENCEKDILNNIKKTIMNIFCTLPFYVKDDLKNLNSIKELYNFIISIPKNKIQESDYNKYYIEYRNYKSSLYHQFVKNDLSNINIKNFEDFNVDETKIYLIKKLKIAPINKSPFPINIKNSQIEIPLSKNNKKKLIITNIKDFKQFNYKKIYFLLESCRLFPNNVEEFKIEYDEIEFGKLFILFDDGKLEKFNQIKEIERIIAKLKSLEIKGEMERSSSLREIRNAFFHRWIITESNFKKLKELIKFD